MSEDVTTGEISPPAILNWPGSEDDDYGIRAWELNQEDDHWKLRIMLKSGSESVDEYLLRDENPDVIDEIREILREAVPEGEGIEKEPCYNCGEYIHEGEESHDVGEGVFTRLVCDECREDDVSEEASGTWIEFDQSHDPHGMVECRKTETAEGKRIWTPFAVETPEGRMTAEAGDVLMRGAEGELYPCASDVFEATYEWVYDEEMPDFEADGVAETFLERYWEHSGDVDDRELREWSRGFLRGLLRGRDVGSWSALESLVVDALEVQGRHDYQTELSGVWGAVHESLRGGGEPGEA